MRIILKTNASGSEPEVFTSLSKLFSKYPELLPQRYAIERIFSRLKKDYYEQEEYILFRLKVN